MAAPLATRIPCLSRVHARARACMCGPLQLFLFSFTSQLIIAKRGPMGDIVEGSEDSVQRALYLIYMRRNPMELDPQLAWEVADFVEHTVQE